MYRTIDLRDAAAINLAGAHGRAGSPQSHQHPLDPHAIAFITCVNDETQYALCLRYLDELQIPSGYTVEKVAIFGATSMAEGYQEAMESSTARYKVYVHQDTYLVDRGLLVELLRLFRIHPRLGIVGVQGATWLPAGGMWWEKNRRNCYGRFVDFLRPPQGFPGSLFRPPNLRRIQMIKRRPLVGDYLPAVALDGLFMATQYDIQWRNPLGGFELYDQVQSLEFIKTGLEVGIARQQAIWCIHWGPLREFSAPRGLRRQNTLDHRAVAFRQLYSAFLRVPAQRLYKQNPGDAGQISGITRSLGTRLVMGLATPADVRPTGSVRERLGVVVLASNRREALVRALRSLVPQLETLMYVKYQVVAVKNVAADATGEGVLREFPEVTVIADAAIDRPARGFNAGLRQLSFPDYVLIMHDDVEFSARTLDRMVSYLRERSSVAGVVASLVGPDGSVQYQRLGIVEMVRRRHLGQQTTTFVGTTCALVRGDVFFDVGLYDERFYCNADLDWSMRAKRKGYTFAFLPQARAIHHQMKAFQQGRPAEVVEGLVDNLRFAYKHGGPRWAGAVYWASRFLVRWLAFRWRNENEALPELNEASVQMDDLHRRFRNENQMPQLLAPE